MTDIQTSYLSGLKDALLRITRRARGGQEPNDDQKAALDGFITEWGEAEATGSLCIKEAKETQVKILESLGLASVFKEKTANDSEEKAQEESIKESKEQELATKLSDKAELLTSDGAHVPLKPFVIDKTEAGNIRIYTNRTFRQEAMLARRLVNLTKQTPNPPSADADGVVEKFERNFDEWNKEKDPEKKKVLEKKLRTYPEQTEAIRNSLGSQLSIISGGPGTGKTTTVVTLLEALLEDKKDALVYLTAPTGKAKKRLWDSVLDQVGTTEEELQKKEIPKYEGDLPNCLESLRKKQLIAKTIHKWLFTKTSANEMPSEDNPLECDILVVDEASMIGCDLACSLFNAVDPKRTRVILLGDKDQLQAVEPGCVFADISKSTGALGNNLRKLEDNHRSNKVIIELAKAINSEAEPPETHIKNVTDVITKGEGVIRRIPESSVKDKAVRDWLRKHMEEYADVVSKHLSGKIGVEDLKKVWNAFFKVRFIAAANEGSGGIKEINQACEGFVKQKLGIPAHYTYYNGQPIIITKNDDSIDVANGDDGIVFRDSKGNWKVYLGDSSGKKTDSDDESEELSNCVDVDLLPDYETAYAITIHKAQGSGFDEIGVFLPDNLKGGDNRLNLATRELLYTAITRAENKCTIFGPEDFFDTCITTPTKRAAGLVIRLKNAVPTRKEKPTENAG